MTIEEIGVLDIAKVLELEKERLGSSLGADEVTASVAGDDYVCYIAKEDDDLIGYILASRSEDEAEIYSVAVREDHEGQGIGKELLTALEKALKDLRVKTILLEVKEGNDRAYNLYKNFGFVEYRRRARYYEGKDAICMRKEIQNG